MFNFVEINVYRLINQDGQIVDQFTISYESSSMIELGGYDSEGQFRYCDGLPSRVCEYFEGIDGLYVMNSIVRVDISSTVFE